jgi:hypothetical protein
MTLKIGTELICYPKVCASPPALNIILNDKSTLSDLASGGVC